MTVVFSFSLGASTGSPVLMNQDGSGIYNRHQAWLDEPAPYKYALQDQCDEWRRRLHP